MTLDDFRRLADFLSEAMALLSGEGILLAVNRPFAQRLGCCEQQIVGRPLAELVRGPDAEVAAYLRACGESPERVRKTFLVRGSDSAARWCCEGALLSPHSDPARRQIVLRLSPDRGKGEAPSGARTPSGARAGIGDTGPVATQPPSVVPRRILVVDDTPSAATLLKMLLTKLGKHDVQTAHDGPSALAVAEQHQPEIVFLDIGLPQMDGYAVAQRLRQQPGLDEALLVALTGYGQADDRRRTQEAGFDEHLVKPASLQRIERMLTHPKLRPLHGSPARPGLREGSEVSSGRRSEAGLEEPPHAEREGYFGAEREGYFGAEREGCFGAEASPAEIESLQATLQRHAEFLRQLAHDVGNLAMQLQLGLELLRQPGSEAPRATRLIDQLRRHLPAMLKFVESVRTVSRVAGGPFAADRQRVDVAALLQSALDRLRSQASDQHLEFLRPPQPLLWSVDAEMLRQAVEHVVGNALEFTQGGGTVRVSAEVEQGMLVIRVRDNGPGIAAALLPGIFDLFVRGNERVDVAGGQLGVGLAFARAAVEAHGGTIEALSAPGTAGTSTSGGTEIVMRLPSAAQPAQSSAGRQ